MDVFDLKIPGLKICSNLIRMKKIDVKMCNHMRQRPTGEGNHGQHERNTALWRQQDGCRIEDGIQQGIERAVIEKKTGPELCIKGEQTHAP